MRLVLQVLEAPQSGGGGEREGFGFVVGLPAHDQRPDHPRQVNSLASARPASPGSLRNFPKRSSVRPGRDGLGPADRRHLASLMQA